MSKLWVETEVQPDLRGATGIEPATTADLVAALIAEGGEIREAGHDLVAREWRLVSYVVDEPGRYLLYGPLPVEGAEATESPEVPT